jgi:hypothetical protein
MAGVEEVDEQGFEKSKRNLKFMLVFSRTFARKCQLRPAEPVRTPAIVRFRLDDG